MDFFFFQSKSMGFLGKAIKFMNDIHPFIWIKLAHFGNFHLYTYFSILYIYLICVQALFCSKSCLQKALNCFHRIECQILSLVGYPVETSLNWLAIRLLMMATKQGKEIEALMTHPVFKNPLKKPTGEFPDRFESQDYYNIQNLEDHLDKKDNSSLLSAVFSVSIHVNILMNTSFLDELCEKNKFVSLCVSFCSILTR